MKAFSQQRLAEVAKKFSKGFPRLKAELLEKLISNNGEKQGVPQATIMAVESPFDVLNNLADRSLINEYPPEVQERIIALTAGARPIAKIRDNKVTTDFIRRNSESWASVIEEKKEFLNRAIPAVGRIELNNAGASWGGTGWLIAPDVVVTNRHVAEIFARYDGITSKYVFRPGLLGRSLSCKMDFREEEGNGDQLEHPITSILWIAGSSEPDVAFLKVKRGQNQPPLPPHLELADEVHDQATIAAIGYPAEDPSIRDQNLVRMIFGDVYDLKRLAPGKVLRLVSEIRLEHDCSTLGGNSGSVLIDLETGKAIGLHHGGYLDDSANLAVPAPYLKKLLSKAQSQPSSPPTQSTPIPPTTKSESNEAQVETDSKIVMKFNIPVELTVRIGKCQQITNAVVDASGDSLSVPEAGALNFDQILRNVQEKFKSHPDVLKIRPGYRFKNKWITDERVIVIEVLEKLPYGELVKSKKLPFPREVNGVGIDIRTASIVDQLEKLGVDLRRILGNSREAEERPGRPGKYTEPAGFDNPTSPFSLKAVRARMNAIFHVSPDSGFPNLRDFFSRVTSHVTATMYEWSEGNHISLALATAISQGEDRKLTMVTQKRGVGGSDATESAVEDMKRRLGSKFHHQWASVRGPNRLIQNSYHIKVSSRDGKEFWLSSGNWKDSNQADIDPAGNNSTDISFLKNHNREWHAIIENESLAKLFQKYIEFDFDQATKFPSEEEEAHLDLGQEFFVPIGKENIDERRMAIRYTAPLKITTSDDEIDIQPILTPDKNADGQRIFMRAAIEMVRRAQHRLYVQNQSFNMSGDDNDELTEFFTALRDKQREINDVRIIIRDASDFGRRADIVRQEQLIERLKAFGFDVSTGRLRLQPKCHTKGIIIDSQEVMLGSHNLTNMGSLFNRDASLLVKSPKVAKYFENLFLFDWEELAHNTIDESPGRILRAAPGELAPTGYVRRTLADLLDGV